VTGVTGVAALPGLVTAMSSSAGSPPATVGPTVSTLASRALAPTVQRAPDAVPPAVQRFVERETGSDLSGVTVHRDTGAQAAGMQAKAFTVGGEVHLPEHHGSLESGEGRNLLAHELT